MDKMKTAINDAIHQLKRHRGITTVSDPVESEGAYVVEIEISVALPSRAKAGGVSNTGVFSTEKCFLVFGQKWPMVAPRVLLREDFPLNLAHINPHKPGDYVSPCLYEGPLSELLHRFGLDGIIDQLISWLDKAAAGNLINYEQGWEPTRRDETSHSIIVCSADNLIAQAPTDGTILEAACTYLTIDGGLYAVLNSPLEQLGSKVFSQNNLGDNWSGGKTAVFIYRAKPDESNNHVISEYQPETVVSLETLGEKAEKLKVDSASLLKQLDDFYSVSVWDTQQNSTDWKQGLYAVVILMAERPVSLIGSPGRNVEILPYIVRYEIDEKDVLARNVTVHPAFHSHAISPTLLANTSGVPIEATNQKLVFLGCGSLGSKIAMHLGRAGFGEATFVDNKIMSPHNLARHALIEPPDGLSAPKKSDLMKSAFEGLSHRNTRSFDMDAIELLLDPEKCKSVIHENTTLVVDSTASLIVLAAETQSLALSQTKARLVRVSMYGQGRCVVMFLEGISRATRVDDLTALLFEKCRNNDGLRAAIAGDTSEPTRVFVGESCSSLTTVMSDSHISRSASVAGIQLERWLEDGIPATGMLCTGYSENDDIGMAWDRLQVGDTKVLTVADDGGWEIRISNQVEEHINNDSIKWDKLETGGALIGRVSLETRSIIVTGVVDAPLDSVRKPTKFIMGTEGLMSDLRLANQKSLGYLCFIGTWHSHPMGGSHSGIDFDTLHKIAEDAGGLPAVSLVWAPDGLKCAVARW